MLLQAERLESANHSLEERVDERTRNLNLLVNASQAIDGPGRVVREIWQDDEARGGGLART